MGPPLSARVLLMLTHLLTYPSAYRARLLANTVPGTHKFSPQPRVGLCIWGEGSLPPIHSPIGGWGEAVEQPVSRSALFIYTLSDFTFLHGPRHMYRPGCCLYEGGMSSRGPPPITHKLNMQVLGSLSGSGHGSFCSVYHYPLPWYGRCFPPVGQRVKGLNNVFNVHCGFITEQWAYHIMYMQYMVLNWNQQKDIWMV